MSRFPSDRHAASWASLSPGNDSSAGKRRSGRTRKGDQWLRESLTECALAASRTRNTYLKAQYLRLRRRRGEKRAIIAVAHSCSSSPTTCSRRVAPTTSLAMTGSSAATTPPHSPAVSPTSSSASVTASPSSRTPRNERHPHFPTRTQGAFVFENTGATEDAESRRPGRSGDTRLHFERGSQSPGGRVGASVPVRSRSHDSTLSCSSLVVVSSVTRTE
jgi:hypothetical protein